MEKNSGVEKSQRGSQSHDSASDEFKSFCSSSSAMLIYLFNHAAVRLSIKASMQMYSHNYPIKLTSCLLG